MTFFKLVFLSFNFIGNPMNGDININEVSVVPNSFKTADLCERAFEEIREQNLTARFTHTCAPVVSD